LYLRDGSGEKRRRRPAAFTLGPLGMFVNTTCLTIHGCLVPTVYSSWLSSGEFGCFLGLIVNGCVCLFVSTW
jgi:hypothetical protein